VYSHAARGVLQNPLPRPLKGNATALTPGPSGPHPRPLSRRRERGVMPSPPAPRPQAGEGSKALTPGPSPAGWRGEQRPSLAGEREMEECALPRLRGRAGEGARHGLAAMHRRSPKARELHRPTTIVLASHPLQGSSRPGAMPGACVNTIDRRSWRTRPSRFGETCGNSPRTGSDGRLCHWFPLSGPLGTSRWRSFSSR
jgi:hypothetical protein